MRYEEFYNEQINKYKKRRTFLTKKLPFLLIGIFILLSILLALFFTSGIPYEYGISNVEFGDSIENAPKSFLASAKYEFLVDGVYQEEAPTKPGTYSYRIASTNIFGITKYSSDYEFKIEKGKAKIYIEDSEVDYGFDPNKIVSDLPYDKKISSYQIHYEDKRKLTTEAWVSDVTIIDSNGLDVTSYYDLEFPKTEITFTKVPLIISLKDKEKIYDGTPLKFEGEEDYTIEGLINGDEDVFIEVEGSQTKVGSSKYNVKSVTIKDKNGNIYETYDYVFEEGNLTVLEREITFTTEDIATTYNGENQEFDSYTLDEEITDSIKVDPISVMLAGTYNYQLTPKFINSDGEDVSNCYKVNYSFGEIVVEPAEAKVLIDNLEKEYSGSTTYSASYTLESGNLFDASLTLEVESELREVGIGKTHLKSYTLTKDGIDVSDSINLEFVDGSITITKKDLTIKPKNMEKEYDGLGFETTLLEQEGLVPQDVLSFTSICTNTEIGNQKLVIDDETISITYKGKDVSSCYNIIMEDATLKITKRKLKIKTYANNITYGDTPTPFYVCGSDEGLLDGDILEVNSYDYTMIIGENDCYASDYSITNGMDHHEDFYDITVVKGTFTISKKELSISVLNKSKTYDGNILGVNDSDYYISSGELLSTDSITFIPSEETLVNVGTKVIVITLENISITSSYLGDVTSCYEIAFNPGTITITPRVIHITTGSITKSYDFGVLTCHEANVSGLASGQVIDMKFTGELFYVGSIANTISEIKVYSSLDENAIDLTSNYTFKIYEGTLTYTERSA